MAITDPKVLEARTKLLEEQKQKNPRAVLLSVDPALGADPGPLGGDVVVVAPPTRPQFRKFKVMGLDERKRPDSLEALLRDCMIWPDPQAFEAMIEKRAALPETFGEQLLELAGAALQVEKNV